MREWEQPIDVLLAAQAWPWQCDVQTGEVAVSPELMALLGYRAEDFGAMTLAIVDSLIDPVDRMACGTAFERYADGGSDLYRASCRARHKDGHWVWLEARGSAIERSADGDILRMAGLVLDVTEGKVLEEQMLLASKYARSLIEASVDPLVTIGVDGRIMDVNAATELATGRSRDELIGSDFSEYFTDPAQARAGYQQVFTQGRVVDYPLTLQHQSGGRMDVLYNASTFHDSDGRVAGVFAAARDVTEARRTQQELEETNREVLLLSEMSDLLQSCQSVEETLPIIRTSIEELFPGMQGRGFILNPSTGQLDEALAFGGIERDSMTVNAPDCWALRRNTIHEVNLGNHLNPPCHYLADESRPYLCIPLQAQGQTLGLMHLIDPEGQTPRGRFVHLARATGDSISLALANVRLRENLQALSTRDPLTGLYNRRFLEEALARELSRAGRNDRTGVVAMLDIDHFKRFNDEFGHDAGDAVLVTVARLLKGFRDTDLPCRYGGEEFLLVLTDLTMEQARVRMEQFRQEMSRQVTFHNGKALPGITVSIGLAPFPHRGEDGAAVIKHADDALYLAKERGRDRIEIAQPERRGESG